MSRVDLSAIVSDRAGISTITPPAADEQYMREALSYLVIVAPFWANLFYSEMQLKYVAEDSPVNTAATDGWCMFYNVPMARKRGWTLKNMAFVIAHEISHGFLGDLVRMKMWRESGVVQCPGGELPYIHELMNQAEDYRINAMLIKGKVGEMPSEGLYDKTLSEQGMESAVEIYEKLYKKAKAEGRIKEGGLKGGSGPGEPHGGFDQHLDPTAQQEKENSSGRREQAVAAAVQASIAAGKGDLPGAIMRIIGEILDPKVPWQEQLRATMLRASGDPTYDWRYLDKRLMVRPDPMYFARQAHNGCGTVVICNDTSGSMSNDMIDRIMAENGGIIGDLNPSRVIVIWCDAAIHNVNDLDEPEDVNDLKADLENQGGVKGGGGTSFKPPFKWVEENLDVDPDMLVYFTDTYGDFPSQEPDYPVIWGVINQSGTVPWGEVVRVEL